MIHNKYAFHWHRFALCLMALAMMVLATPAAKAGSNDSDVNDNISAAGNTDVYTLHGEWEFYWDQLLLPADFRDDRKPQGSKIQVPSSWVGQTLGKQVNNGQPLPRFGYATYRKTLELNDQQVGRNSALFFRYIDSAFRIWIDGTEYDGSGTVGKERATEQPNLAMQLIYFTPQDRSVDIVIQVSNFSFREGGIVGVAKWGEATALTSHVFLQIAVQDIVFISSFLLLSLYHLIVFFSRRQELSFLWLGLLTFFLSLRTLLLSEYLVQLLLPGLEWQTIIRIEFISEVLVMVFFVLFFHAMYPKDVHRLPLRITIVYSACLLVYFSVASTEQFTGTILYHWSVYFAILLYYLFYLGVLSVLRKREGARLNMLGVLVVCAAIINDVLYYSQLIDSLPLASVASVVFFFMQAILIAFRYSKLFRQNTRLTGELQTINLQLEEKVVERTAELQRSNEQLIEFDQQRTELLENIAHDLGSPLAGMETNLYVLQKGVAEPQLQSRVVQQMRRIVDNMKRLVEDLFDMTRLNRNDHQALTERVNIRDLQAKIKEYLQEKAEWGQIVLDIGGDVKKVEETAQVDDRANVQAVTQAEGTVCVDVDVTGIMRVVQNYLDNAVKFSSVAPCPVRVEFSMNDQHFRFALTDYGKGITATELPHIFERFYKGEGTRKGIGLGLAIAKEIMEWHGGEVGVRSESGSGSTFWFTIPLSAAHRLPAE